MLVLTKKDMYLGQKFSKPVFFDDNKSMFLAAKLPVSQAVLNVFDEWPIEKLYCDGVVLDDDDLDDSDDIIEEIEELSIADEADIEENLQPFNENALYKEYVKQASRVKSIFSHFAAKKYDGIINDVISVANDIYAVIQEDENFVLSTVLYGKNDFLDFSNRAVNTAVLSCVISERLNVEQPRIITYMQGALLHDIGMLQFSDELGKITDKLSDSLFSQVKMHTLNAYSILKDEIGFSDEIAQMTLCHHEQQDGKGYPNGISGERISDGASIIAVADVFESMLSKRSYRNSLLGAAAIKRLMAYSGKKYDAKIVSALVKALGIFPIGSVVLLNTQEKASVVENNPDFPLRPKINCDGQIIDLSQSKEKFILRALSNDEISSLKV